MGDEFTAALLAVADDPAGLDRLIELAESGDVDEVADGDDEDDLAESSGRQFSEDRSIGPTGPPPFPGAVFDRGRHRWVKPSETPKPKAKSAAKLPPAGEVVTPEQHAAVIRKAKAKAKSAPVPTAEEKSFARQKVDELGANKYRRNLVGNTADRAKRRQQLYAEFGDGERCPCLYCGVVVSEGTLEQDKIVTTAMGGKYRTPNLVPSCSDCNKRRGDMPFEQAMKKVVKRVQ